MHTSYFAKSSKHPNAVSIAAKAPDWFSGRQYKKLAPKYWFFKKYKEDGDIEFYIEQYQKEVLNTLDPKIVFEELGSDAVLLCWEKTDDFCHRYLVAGWIEKNLNIYVGEL
jgi:uncharacterized protein (DUF488 family)